MGTLYVVSTPIGNLEDLSPRALATLGEVDAILAEDTRRTRRLMTRFGLSTPMVSLHAHNEASRIEEVLARLRDGQELALVSDAGTPLVSDPGLRLVRRAIEDEHRIVPIPGPSAVLAALSCSGFIGTPFTFLGFLPRKGTERERHMERVADAKETVVLFESPERLASLLSALADACGGERAAVVARELTKVYEEFRRGTLQELADHYEASGSPKGEVTVIIAPDEPESGLDVDTEVAEAISDELLDRGAAPSRAARQLAQQMGIPRNQAYRIVQDRASARETEVDLDSSEGGDA